MSIASASRDNSIPPKPLKKAVVSTQSRLSPIFVTRVGRLKLLAVSVLAGISLVSSAILRVHNLRPPNDTPSDYFSLQFWNTTSPLIAAATLAFFTFMHIFYMLSVINDNVLIDIRFPRQKADILKRYLAATLCVAYWTPLIVYLGGIFISVLVLLNIPIPPKLSGAVATSPMVDQSFGPTSTLSETIMTALFLLVYWFWFRVDQAELKHLSRMGTFEHIRNDVRKWRNIDLFLFVVLALSLIWIWIPWLPHSGEHCPAGLNNDSCLWLYGSFQRWDRAGHVVWLIEPKDLVVLFCVAYLLRERTRNNLRDDIYASYYSDYINMTAPAPGRWVALLNDGNIVQMLIDRLFAMSNTPPGEKISVLDFGCADGRRMQQFFGDILTIDNSQWSKLFITGVEQNSWWREKWDIWRDKWQRSKGIYFPGRFEGSTPDGAVYKMIYISHLLYDLPEFHACCDLINEHADDETIIVVRGTSANTPFYWMSFALAESLTEYHPHHHWTNLYLLPLIERCRLKPLDENLTAGNPDIRVKQTVDLTRENTLPALLSLFFSRRYRELTRQSVMLLGSAGVARIPNDDHIWIFRRSGQ